MAPTIVAVTSATAIGATATATVNSVVAGDWIVVGVSAGYETASPTPGGTGSGTWTQIGGWVGTTVGNFNVRHGVWRKIATGSGSYTVTVGTFANEINLAVYHLRGVDSVAAQSLGAVDQDDNTNTVVATPGITPGVTDTLLINFYSLIQFSGAPTWTPPGSMTERHDFNSSPNTWLSSGSASQVLAGSGATGTRTATSTVGADPQGKAWSLVAFVGGGSANAQAAEEFGIAYDASVGIDSHFPRVMTTGANTDTSGTSHVCTMPAGITAGDLLLAFFTNDGNATATPSAGWTSLGTTANSTLVRHSVFYKTAAGSDTLTVTTSVTEGTSHIIYRIVNHTGNPQISAAATGTSTAPNSASLTGSTPSTYANLWFSSAGADSNINGNTGPAGYNAQQAVGGSTASASTYVGWRDFQGNIEDPGAYTIAASEEWVAYTVMVPGNPTDVFAPAETPVGVGTAGDVVGQADQGTLTDTGTGTDTLDVQQQEARDLTDTGTGTEIISVDQSHFWFDTGAGDDTIGGPDAFVGPMVDGGAGNDVIGLFRQDVVTDSGTGVDLVDILVIPYTQVLPARRQRSRYELVVVARIMNSSGAPTFLEVDPIDWVDMDYTRTLSQPQELNVSCLLSMMPESILQRMRRPADQPIELWLYRDGDLVFAGPLKGGTVDDDVLKLNAKGLLSYIDRMYVESDYICKGVDQASVVKGLIDGFQGLPYGNYGIDTTSITTTGVNIDVTYTKAEMVKVSKAINDLSKATVGFDYEVNPTTRKLQVWAPQKGVDRSVGEDAVVFDNRNITSTSVMFSVDEADVATVAYGTGTAPQSAEDGDTYSKKTNDTLMVTYGRSGITGSWQNVVNQGMLDGYVQGLLDVRGTPLVLPGTDSLDTPDASIDMFDVGDTVLYDPNPILMGAGAYRIRSINVKVETSGSESITLEFT